MALNQHDAEASENQSERTENTGGLVPIGIIASRVAARAERLSHFTDFDRLRLTLMVALDCGMTLREFDAIATDAKGFAGLMDAVEIHAARAHRGAAE